MKRILLLTILTLVPLVGPSPAHGQIGVQAWAQRFSFTGASSFSMDEAQKIAADASGNVIVVGSSNARITDYDWVIIKYSGAGVPLWTNRYKSPANWRGPGQCRRGGRRRQRLAGEHVSEAIQYRSLDRQLWT